MDLIVKQYDDSDLIIQKGSKFDNFLIEFEDKIKKWQCFSLVAKSTLTDIYNWHFIEALSIFKLIKDNAENLDIVDFGAGSGVIGITLSKYGISNVKLVDRSNNKIFFMKDIVKFDDSFEFIENYSESLILVRGVTSILEILNLLYPVKKIIFLKSFKVKKEIEEALKYYDFIYKIYPRLGRAKGFIVFLESIEKQ